MQKEYEWNLKDAVFTKDKGKVFSCFACGGGSTMGYKLAGFDVIGCNEIDPKMNSAYVANHNPKFNFLMPIQEFKNLPDLPKELFELDILDGSPPCSSFSTAGNRDADWGKKKKFREGQAEQVLDTLFFDFIDLAKRLQPKVVIAENVKGLLLGEAIHYVRRIKDEFEKAGYYIQWKLLDASTMGVPQKRERVFFIALRKDLAEPFLEQINFFEQMPKIELEFNEKPIIFGDIMEEDGVGLFNLAPCCMEYIPKLQPGESCGKYHPKGHYHGAFRINLLETSPTILSNWIRSRLGAWISEKNRTLSKKETCLIGSYPLDYDFLKQSPNYLIGMSVPPLMTKKIAQKIHEQWLSKIEVKK